MRSRKRKIDYRNLLIGILLLVVAVESFILWKKQNEPARIQQIKKGSQASPETKTVLKIIPPRPEAPTSKRKSAQQIMGRIAIIIDDWGYAKHCDLLEQIKNPVTVAILPSLPHSVDIAECAYAQKKEVMLHIPLEPHKNLDKYPEDYIIRTSMSKGRVLRLFAEELSSIPHAAGINNHMGSKATEDRRLMSILFEQLKDRNLFFVDSMVTSRSICRNLAKDMNLRFTQRDVFLDNRNERHYIENQFIQLAKLAKDRGFAVGIGHDRPLTLQIIKEQTAILKEKGFQFLIVSEFIDQQ